ncbi:hypothetical protein B0H13DRAFT_1069299 [Mycena leptocephala]|nr:hypothetical protein B0H13DRAFT_1069299 [Mycena leptocephala]
MRRTMSWGPSSAAQYRWSRTGLGRSAAQPSSASAGINRITRGAALHDTGGESRRGCADVEYGAGGDVKQRLLAGSAVIRHVARRRIRVREHSGGYPLRDWVYVYEATAVASAMCARVQDRRGGGLVRRDRCSPDARSAALEMGGGSVPRSCSLVRRDSTCPSQPDGVGTICAETETAASCLGVCTGRRRGSIVAGAGGILGWAVSRTGCVGVTIARATTCDMGYRALCCRTLVVPFLGGCGWTVARPNALL